MKLSAQEEYSLRCLIAIARSDSGCLTIPEVASREGISNPLAGKTLAQLRKLGFILSTRGQIGGYVLARPAAKILVSEVLGATGGRLFDEEFCDRFEVNGADCIHRGHCTLNPLYRNMQAAIDQALAGVTVADLLQPKDVVPASSLVGKPAK